MRAANRKQVSGFTWFRLGMLGAFVLAAGSLYTPYPAALVRAFRPEAPQEKVRTVYVEKEVPAPEPEPVTRPWNTEAVFRMPEIQLPPFPPALPEKVEPGRYTHFNSVDRGVNLSSAVHFNPGTTASQDRKLKEAYRLDVSLELMLPQAARGEELLRANPQLPEVLRSYNELMQAAQVSQWYHALYLHKQNRVRHNAATLARILDRHNFYDTDTVLEIEAPSSGRKLVWLQADMDVVSDGSDGDRLPDMPEKVKNSDYYQPSTSYRWKKLGDSPNPLLPHWQQKVEKLKKDPKAAEALRHARNVVHDLKKYSFLLAEYDPFVVIPLTFKSGDKEAFRPQLGDYVAVIVGNRVFPAIVGDYGPRFKTGEASLRLARLVNPKATPYARPVSHLGVSYLIFPGTAEPEKGPINYELMNQKVQQLLNEMGGLGEGAQFCTVQDLLAKPEPAEQASPSAQETQPAG